MRPEKAEKAIGSAVDLFGQLGIDNTSTQAIAKHAGIGNATLFKYFETKEVLIRESYLKVKMEIVAAVKKNLDPTDRFERLLRTVWINYFNWSIDHPLAHSFVRQIKTSRFVDPQIEEKIQHEFLFFTVALNAAKSSGEVIDEPLELIQTTMLMFLEMAIDFARSEIPITEHQVYRLMLNSLKVKSTAS